MADYNRSTLHDKSTTKPHAAKPGSENKAAEHPQASLAELGQRAQHDPRLLATADVLRLQRAVGNQAVFQMLSAVRARPVIQTKLTVGAAHDAYEQEADSVADHVMSASVPAGPVAQREASEEEEPIQTKPLAAGISRLQRKNEENEDESNRAIQRDPEEDELQTAPALGHSEDGFEAGADFESQLRAARSGGSQLSGETRGFMEQRIGADFNAVRVHTDSQADRLNRSIQSRAFTTGPDVFFRQGEYQPSSPDGQRLLAHELTHVVQQTGAAQAKRVFGGQAPVSAAQRLFARSAAPEVQRYSASAGFFKNKVKFELQNYAATLAKPLQIKKKANLIKISSQDYRANGTVKASGPKDRVSQFQLGMLQTVYDSRRIFYYEPAPYKPSLLQQIGTAIAPGLLGDRVKVTDMCKPLPVRDGDNGVVPWYEVSDTANFDNAPDSTKSTQIYDRPGTAMGWTQTVNGKEQQLVKTRGQDSFRTWVSVQEKGTTGFMGMHRLAYIDWKVDYGTDVTYNSANPAASVVTPTGESGGKITQISDGFGAYIPLMGDPVANDAATDETGKW